MQKFAVFFALFLTFSCASNTILEGNSRTEYALAALVENILTTDFTALVKVTQIQTQEIIQASAAEDSGDLLAVIYTANVLQNYQGNLTERIEYTQYIDKSEGLEGLSRGELIVSLCRDKDGDLYLPDIGFELPAKKALRDKAEETKSLIETKQLSLLRDDRYACCPYSPGPCP